MAQYKSAVENVVINFINKIAIAATCLNGYIIRCDYNKNGHSGGEAQDIISCNCCILQFYYVTDLIKSSTQKHQANAITSYTRSIQTMSTYSLYISYLLFIL